MPNTRFLQERYGLFLTLDADKVTKKEQTISLLLRSSCTRKSSNNRRIPHPICNNDRHHSLWAYSFTCNIYSKRIQHREKI